MNVYLETRKKSDRQKIREKYRLMKRKRLTVERNRALQRVENPCNKVTFCNTYLFMAQDR